MQNTCKYSHLYYNFEKKIDETFQCNMGTIPSSQYCEFHDSTYLNSTTKLLIKQSFEKLIDDVVTNQKELFCIGYILPTINIDGKKFSKHAYFSQAKFLENSNFTNCEFLGVADFTRCEFKDNVSFTGSTFKSDAKFSQIVISGSLATFQNTTYSGKADFKSITANSALFTMSEFNEVLFIGANFNGYANFWNSNFNSNCDFSLTAFKDKVNFSCSKFKNQVTFEQVIFEYFANFRRITFENQCKVFFNTNLLNVSFLETDITRIRFGDNTKFNELGKEAKFHEKIMQKISPNNTYKIIDEKRLENKDEPDLDLESVMDVYRNFRDNYDFQLRYDTAGEFFVRELEIKRKYKKNSRGAIRTTQKNRVNQCVSILGAYNLIAQYGNSYYRPIFVAIPILCLSTFYFITKGFSNLYVISSYEYDLLKESTIRSLSAFFPFYTFNKYNAISDFILRIILLPISGSFFITLKRKLERKFRH